MAPGEPDLHPAPRAGVRIRAGTPDYHPSIADELAEVADRGGLTDGTDDFDEVRYMLLEERRREFFAEGGRYWSTKIQNTDVLWFPRLQGATPFQGYNLQGAVRQLFATDEYEQNDYFVAAGGLESRGTGCSSLGTILGTPGSQAPVFN